MRLRICRTTVIAFIFGISLPAWGQQYLLYTPQPVTSAQPSPSQEGILVQEIEIKRGDTLYDLSRKFSGRGMYYPQILLFNTIKNPNLIYAGSTLKIPVQKDYEKTSKVKISHSDNVSSKSEASVNSPSIPEREAPSVVRQATEIPLNDQRTVGKEKSVTTRHKKKSAVAIKKQDSTTAKDVASDQPQAHLANAPATVSTENSQTSASQKLFEAATKAYRMDDCRTALELLDRYLADNSGSLLAADANLYKAECYLKLSSQ